MIVGSQCIASLQNCGVTHGLRRNILRLYKLFHKKTAADHRRLP